MNFDEIVDNRRSARLFTNDDVSKKQLEKDLIKWKSSTFCKK